MASSEQVDVASRAAELRRLVAHHNHRYHVLDEPEIPDSAYDALYAEYLELHDWFGGANDVLHRLRRIRNEARA